MIEAQDGYAYLEALREENHKKRQSYQDFSAYLDQKAREKGIPISGQFELTPLCNFDCKMCYVHLTKEQLHSRTLLTVEQWKDIMRQAWEAGMIEATLTGGECLTYPGFRDIYLYLQSLGVVIKVLSNGSLMNEEWVRFFQAHPPYEMYVTFYGGNEEVYERVTGHRAFNTVASNLRMVQEAGLPLNITVTPSRYLGEDVFDTVHAAQSICPRVAVNSTLFSPREETGRAGLSHDASLELYARVYRHMEEQQGNILPVIPADRLPPAGGPHHVCEERGFQCGGGRSCFSIDWKGVMNPCTEMGIVRAYPLRDGFLEAWRLINRAVNAWPRVPECQECPYEQVCSNCAARVLQYGQAGTRQAALCERTKYFVQNGVIQLPKCE